MDAAATLGRHVIVVVASIAVIATIVYGPSCHNEGVTLRAREVFVSHLHRPGRQFQGPSLQGDMRWESPVNL